jgi:ubiquinone/menaquinone biosynthesis C-methylase UbiE
LSRGGEDLSNGRLSGASSVEAFVLQKSHFVGVAALAQLVLQMRNSKRLALAIIAIALAALAQTARRAATLGDDTSTYLGRELAQPMSHLGAAWLDRPDRDATQKPEHVLDVLGVKSGQRVADVGCGSGYFTVHLARRVGPSGRVFATDLQPEMLALLGEKTRALRLENISPVLTADADARLPEGSLDLVLMVDVYHELAQPQRTLAQVKRALRPGGRLALVEYRAEDPEVAIKPEHKMTLEQISKELSANGWALVLRDESLPEQRILAFAPIAAR